MKYLVPLTPLLFCLTACEQYQCPESEKIDAYTCNSVYDDYVACELHQECPTYGDYVQTLLVERIE
jgi:hypothetical protein